MLWLIGLCTIAFEKLLTWFLALIPDYPEFRIPPLDVQIKQEPPDEEKYNPDNGEHYWALTIHATLKSVLPSLARNPATIDEKYRMNKFTSAVNLECSTYVTWSTKTHRIVFFSDSTFDLRNCYLRSVFFGFSGKKCLNLVKKFEVLWRFTSETCSARRVILS